MSEVSGFILEIIERKASHYGGMPFVGMAEKLQNHFEHFAKVVSEQDNASLKSRIEELEAHNAAMREALEKVKDGLEFFFDAELDAISDGAKEYDICNTVLQALALTPSAALEVSRKRDGLIKRLVRHLSRYRKGTSLGDQPQIISQLAEDVIEAARELGIGDKA